MSHDTRKHLPVVVRQCTQCSHTFMSVGNGPSAVDIRLAFPRPVTMDGKGNDAEGTCPIHPRNR
jgi:hypothetical protein